MGRRLSRLSLIKSSFVTTQFFDPQCGTLAWVKFLPKKIKADLEQMNDNVRALKKELENAKTIVAETRDTNDKEKQELKATIKNLQPSIQESESTTKGMSESMCRVPKLKDIGHKLPSKDEQLADASVQLTKLELMEDMAAAKRALNVEKSRVVTLENNLNVLRNEKDEYDNEIVKL